MLSLLLTLATFLPSFASAGSVFVKYSAENANCLSGKLCDGSEASPSGSLLEALDFAFNETDPTSISLTDSVYQVNSTDTTNFVIARKKQLPFEDSGLWKKEIVIKGYNEKRMLLFNDTYFSLLLKNCSISFLNIDIMFLANTGSTLSYFISYKSGGSNCLVELTNCSLTIDAGNRIGAGAKGTILVINEAQNVSFKATNSLFNMTTLASFSQLIYVSNTLAKTSSMISFEKCSFLGNDNQTTTTTTAVNSSLYLTDCSFLKTFKYYYFIANEATVVILRTNFEAYYDPKNHTSFLQSFNLNRVSFYLLNSSLIGRSLPGFSVEGSHKFLQAYYSNLNINGLFIQKIYLYSVFFLNLQNVIEVKNFSAISFSRNLFFLGNSNYILTNNANASYGNSSHEGGTLRFGDFVYASLNNEVRVTNGYFLENWGMVGSVIFEDRNTVKTIVENCTFIRNVATNIGSVIYAQSSNNNALFKNCRLESNVATTSVASLFIVSSQNVTVTGCVFFNSSIKTLNGGFAGFLYVTNLLVMNCYFRSSTVQASGAIIFDHCINLTVKQLFMIDSAVMMDNGFILIYYCSKVFVRNSVFKNGWASRLGGALGVYYSDNLFISFCDFNSNYAETGGNDLFCRGSKLLSIDSSTFINRQYLSLDGYINLFQCSQLSISNSLFSKPYIELYSKGTEIYSYYVQDLVISSCYFTNSSTNYNDLLFFVQTSKATIRNSIFYDLLFVQGGSVFYSQFQDGLSIENCFFYSNAGKVGGVLNIERSSNIVVRNSNFLSNQADYGAIGSIKLVANLTFTNLILLDNRAIIYGGFFYAEVEAQVIINNTKIFGSQSVLLGSVIYANQTSNILIINMTHNDSTSLLGAHFYAGPLSKIKVQSSTLGRFSAQFKGSELIKLLGSNASIFFEDCIFKSLSDVFIRDLSINGGLEISRTMIVLSDDFDQNEIFSSNGKNGRVVLSKLTLIMNKRDFDAFFHSDDEDIALSVEEVYTVFNRFKRLTSLDQTRCAVLNFSSLTVENFQGKLIEVSHQLASNTSSISIQKSRFLISTALYPFIELRSLAQVKIENCVFKLMNDMMQPIILCNISAPDGANTSLSIWKTLFLSFEKNVLREDQSSPYGLFQSEGALKTILMRQILVSILQKNLKALVLLQGARQLVIDESSFAACYLNKISHLILVRFGKELAVTIVKSKIINNRVVYGGLISFESLSVIKEDAYFQINVTGNEIKYNRAVNRGGLIYFNTSAIELGSNYLAAQLRDSLNFNSNSIKMNDAAVGVFVYWEGDYPPVLETLQKTVAKKREGEETAGIKLSFAASVDRVEIIDITEYSRNLTNLRVKAKIVQNKKSKGENFYYCIASFDKYDNLLTAESDRQLKASSTDEIQIASMNFSDLDATVNYQFYQGLYCANKFQFHQQYSEKVGSTLNFTLDPWKHIKIFPYLNKSKVVASKIQIELDRCKQGELFDGAKCLPCERNSYTNNLDLSSLYDCRTCTEFDSFNCYGGNLRSPKRNFWRINDKSEKFLRCLTTKCEGDEQFARNFTEMDCESCYLPGSNKELLFFSYDPSFTAIGSCAHAYTGELCTECIEGYGASSNYKCSDCQSLSNYFVQFLKLALKLFLFYYTNWKAMRQRFMAQDFTSLEFVNEIRCAYLLKSLFKYFTILGILKSLPLELNINFDDILNNAISISPTEDFDIFSFECLLKGTGVTIPPVFSKVIFSLAFYVFSLCFLLLLTARMKTDKRRTFFETLRYLFMALLLIFLMDNIILILGPFLKILFCVNIGDDNNVINRLLGDLKLNCWDSRHRFFVYLFSIPVITLVAVVTPLFILARILRLKQTKNLWTERYLRKYGYFIYPYRNEFIYFEVFVLVNKVLLVCFKEIFILNTIRNEELFVIIVFLIYLIAYYFIQSKASPFREDNYSLLQRVELYSILLNISNCIVALIWNLAETRLSQSLLYLLISYVGLTNAVFLVYWGFIYFDFFKAKLVEVRAKVNSVLNKRLSKTKTGEISRKKSSFSSASPTKLNSPAKSNVERIKELNKEIRSLKALTKLLAEHIVELEAMNQKNIITLEENLTVESTRRAFIQPKVLVDEPESAEDVLSEGNINMDILSPVSPTKKKINFLKHRASIKQKGGEEVRVGQLELKQKKGEGSNFYNHIFEFVFEYTGEDDGQMNFDAIKSLDKDWKIKSHYDVYDKRLECYIRKLTYWDDLDFTKRVSFAIPFVENNQGKSLKMKKLDIDVSAHEVLRIDNLEWKIAEKPDFNKLHVLTETLKEPVAKRVSELEWEGEMAGTFVAVSPVFRRSEERVFFKISQEGTCKLFSQLNTEALKVFWGLFEKVLENV